MATDYNDANARYVTQNYVNRVSIVLCMSTSINIVHEGKVQSYFMARKVLRTRCFSSLNSSNVSVPSSKSFCIA